MNIPTDATHYDLGGDGRLPSYMKKVGNKWMFWSTITFKWCQDWFADKREDNFIKIPLV